MSLDATRVLLKTRVLSEHRATTQTNDVTRLFVLREVGLFESTRRVHLGAVPDLLARADLATS